ncbi:MAG: zf-HC2 domain-containing protein [Acidimicrobiia bacterium]
MTSEIRCEEVRELAPEVALDIATGEDRDAVLRHLTRCTACRQLVFELSSVGDGLLLLLAPTHDPDAGFESRVLDVLTDQSEGPRQLRPRRKPWLKVALAAATVAAVAVLAGTSVYLAAAADRQLGEDYRATLAVGRGSSFAAAALDGSEGRVGTVFGYQGSPSWVMVTLDSPSDEEQRYEVEAATRGGEYVAIGVADFGRGDRTWGDEIPVGLSEIVALRFVGPDGSVAFVATLAPADPWE